MNGLMFVPNAGNWGTSANDKCSQMFCNTLMMMADLY